MGTLTLTELKDEVRSGLASRTDTDDRLTRVLNISQQRIARIRRWQELERILELTITNSGTIKTDRRTGLPNYVRDFYSVLLIDTTTSTINRKLKYIAHRDWDKRHPYPEDTDRARPREYTIWQSSMEFWPIQDTDYDIRARVSRFPAAFDDDSPNAVSDLSEKDDILISAALSYLFTSLRMMDDAGRWFAIYKDLLNAAISNEAEKPDLDRGPTGGQAEHVSIGQYWLDPFQQVNP